MIISRKAAPVISPQLIIRLANSIAKPFPSDLRKGGDNCLVQADYVFYVAAQERVETLCRLAAIGKFSSDRTISEYAKKIWSAKPVLK